MLLYVTWYCEVYAETSEVGAHDHVCGQFNSSKIILENNLVDK